MAISKFLDPKNDVAFHRIFGTEKNKDILIHFINDILELKGSNRVKEVTFLSPIQVPDIAAKKQSIVDVLCKDENGVQIIVEMQVSPQEGFEKRAQYYAAKAYSQQLSKGSNEGSRYVDLKAVVFIAICGSTIFPDKIHYKSDHVILDRKTYANDLKDFSFTFIELSKFKITDINLLTNIVEKWCYFFKNADETSEADMSKIIGSDYVIERAYEELNQFNWTEEELRTYEREIKRVMDNRAAEDYMLNQLKKLEQMERRIAEIKITSKIEGIEKGIAEGIEKGKAEEKIKIAKNLIAQNLDIKTISMATDLTISEIEELKS